MRSQEGFTFIEAAVVIVVLGILMAAAIPKVGIVVDNMRLHAAVRKTVSDMRYVRELALSRHKTYGVEFQSANNLYQAFELNGTTKTPVTDPYRGQPMIVDFDDLPQFKGVSIGAVNTCQGVGCASQELRIDLFGKPYDANGISLSNTASVTLQNGSATKTVEIIPETAYCRIV